MTAEWTNCDAQLPPNPPSPLLFLPRPFLPTPRARGQFASMLRNNMITAALGLYDVDCHTMYSAYQLGGDVCGHPGTVHG